MHMETGFLSALAPSSLAALVTSIGIYTIRSFAEWGQRNTTYFIALAAAALTTPLGMLISYPAIKVIDKSTLGALLSLSVGTLVYVGATHLLPRAEHEHKKYSFVALGGGILVAIIIVLSMA